MIEDPHLMTVPELGHSFAGCDGGNIRAKLWVCGIEPHGGVDVLDAARPWLSPRSVAWQEPPSWPAGFAAALLESHPAPLPVGLHRAWRLRRGSYDFLLATLCCRIFASPLSPREYLTDRLYRAAGDLFKLNLFPLACNRDTQREWTPVHQLRTNCALKRDYVEQVLQHRGPFYRTQIAEHKPRVILCTGIARREKFLGTLLPSSRAMPAVPVNGRAIESHQGRDTDCRLFVVPFLGTQRSMLSEASFDALADAIRPLVNPTG
jgi:hypothetical protein